MAHLSARHGDAKRRRDELFRERSLVIAAKTGYPFDFRAKSSVANTLRAGARAATATEPPPLVANVDVKRFTADELAEAWQQAQERLQRCEAAGEEAPALAAKRLREHKQRARRAHEQSIDALITQQPSSLEAMNIARMLSPRFEERVAFAPAVARHSAEDERVKHLLASARVGSYYQ
ncbi:hypothetical protein PybrP1_008489 [[Pythium] brassicae (nom. inval.)]|nr:hypothetical protein PybrP1_008489 [[Pythium] brassicae (nom. inval.)]